MPKRKAFVIVNPTSGKRTYTQVLNYLEDELKKAGWEFEIIIPDSENHTRDVARESGSHGYDTVVAVGGDGTIHTILEGMDIENQALGIIPLGSGNDLYRMLKLKKDPEIAIRNLIDGNDWKVDVGLYNGKRFLNTAGTGIDSETIIVRRDTEGWVKRNYVLLFLKTLNRLKPFRIKATADGRVIDDYFMWGIVCNNNYIGGGMMIAPHAKQDDGLLDLILIGRMSKIRMISKIPSIFKGTFTDLPEVTEIKASEVTFETDTPRELNIDGDLHMTTPGKFTVLPRVLSLISTMHTNK